jgi:ankyrin repeat protein
VLSKFRFPVFVLIAVFICRASAAQLPSADIYTAIRNNDLAKLKSLAAGKNASTPDDRGRTPLMLAASVGTTDAMKVLIAAGADVNAADSFGSTALMFGIRDIAKVRVLLDAGSRADEKSKQNQTALLLAASNSGAIETARLLVAKGADPKIVGASGRTGLIMAANQNDLAMVQYFLDQGVNVNAVDSTDKFGHTALMAAAAQANTPMVKALIQKGADVNMATTDAASVKNGPLAFKGRTALMMAAPYGSPEMIRLFLDAHANVNVRDIAGMTPLMFAVASENQDPEVVKMLLAAGADEKIQSTTGETALDWARKYGNPTVLKLLSAEAKAPASARAPALAAIPNPADFRSMIQASVALLQQSSKETTTNGGCQNCHHQILTGLALTAAHEKSIPVDEPAATDQWKTLSSGLRARENGFVQRLDSGGGLDSILYTLFALQSNKYPADSSTDAMMAYILSRQLSDGRWPREEASRAPLQDSDFYRVALAVSDLRAYAPPSMKAEVEDRMGRTRRWLTSTLPKTTDDYAMRLLALQRSGAPQADVQAAAKSLLGLQRPDGGWGGNKNLDSDAFATSESMCALVDSGMITARDPLYQRGVQFLIGTRAKDGSWHVASRAPKFQPYFESGFPYGHDQWISAAATARSVVALARYIQ